MQNYLDLLRDVRTNGTPKTDRTGVGTVSVFGRQLRWSLAAGFPLVTTKKVFLRGVIEELLWFLRGETNIQSLLAKDVHIWDAWATETGELGPVYGAMWRSWPLPGGGTLDQIAALVHELKTNPDSRRLIVSAWNPALLPDPRISPQANAAAGRQALPPCHTLFQFYVAPSAGLGRGRLSCQLYQRSADLLLGVPFNIASYSLLTLMLAQVCGYAPGDFVHTFGDAHIYTNHFSQVDEQLTRAPLPLPAMKINPAVTDLFAFRTEDFTLENYECHPAIRAPVAV